ncbi:uncharacterized protein LOC143299682 [Babylonia areolata]|uniref:uncharacterized protein LOC143299682 n=1 Tax=Babylonia areolata TaxID=304850 RepID=UPI003FD3941C
MIKFIVALCVLVQLSLAQDLCSSDSDCTPSECCASDFFGHHLGQKKRFILGDLLHHHGACMPLAQEGHSCEPDMDIFGGSKPHSFGCPCAEGLECHGESESHNGGSHSYRNPKCMAAGTYTGGPTNQPVTDAPATTSAPEVDTNQPVHELPGK